MTLDKTQRTDVLGRIPPGWACKSDTDEKYAISSTTAPDSRPPSHQDLTPTDRGAKAWLTVLGAASFLFCCGQITAFSVFETWYAQNQLRNLSPSTISWIGSVQLGVLYLSGSIVGRLFDAYGPHVIIFPGSVLLVASTMITSICNEYYQFLLVQGLLTGLAYGMLFYPSFASISTHFVKYRATASGIAIAGAGVGGVVFPIIFRYLFPKIGFGWSVRAFGFVLLALCALGNATLTSRIPPGRNAGMSALPDATILHDIPYVLLVVGCFLVNFGLFIPFVYISNYSIAEGVPSSTSFYIVSAMNAGSIVGRIAPAFLSDLVGRFNIMVPATFLTGVLALAMWTFAKSLVAIVVFAVLYGGFAGAFLAMQIPCVSQISDIKEVGTRIGILYSVASFGVLAGGPVAGAILRAFHDKYEGMVVVCGVLNIVGGALIAWSKLRVDPHIFARV